MIYARPKFSVRAAATFGSSHHRSEMCSHRFESEITDAFILPATTKRQWLVKSILALSCFLSCALKIQKNLNINEYSLLHKRIAFRSKNQAVFIKQFEESEAMDM